MARRRSYGIGERWQTTGESLVEGGQAHVHVVVDTTGEREGEYVLKLLKNANRTPRLDREIETTRRLNSLKCPVLEIVDDYLRSEPEAARPWYVAPRIAGGALSRHLTPGESYGGSLRSALLLYQRILAAVASVHANGVAHRDLKPDNILMDGERVVLGDLGLSLALGEVEGERLTAELERIGSLHYTPPEAFSRRPIDQQQFAFDAFAMGKIFYEVVAGTPLPAFVNPHDPEYDLTKKRDSATHRAINRVLRGLLHDDVAVRLVYLKELEDQIPELLTLEDSATDTGQAVPRWHSDLLSVSDLLATRPSPVKSKKPEELLKEETDMIAREILDVWTASDAVRQLETALGTARGGRLSVTRPAMTDAARTALGGLQPTRKGLEPMEDREYPFRPVAESGAHLMVSPNYPEQDPFRQLTLFASVGAKDGNTVVALGIIRREIGDRATTDIVHGKISVVHGRVGDPTLTPRARAEAANMLGSYVQEIIAEVKSLTRK